jgi:hypothetical protein
MNTTPEKRVYPGELLGSGGKWLAMARTWIQWNVPRGDDLTWGSEQRVTLTVRQIEDLAAHVAATVINEERAKKQ